MKPHDIVIKAADENQARQQAADRLQTPPANLAITPADNGRFKAELIHCDAQVRLTVSDDEMKAFVTGYSPAKGEGRPMTLELLSRQMLREGIQAKPIPDQASKLLDALSKGKTVTKILIAQGTFPEPAQDGTVEPLGDWRYPVFPGDGIGKIIRAIPAEEGMTVTGKKVPPTGDRSGRSVSFPPEGRTYIDKASLVIRSEAFGLVEFENQEIRVIPLIATSSDDMEVRATIYEQDFSGKPFTEERMQSALEAEGIAITVDSATLMSAQVEARERHIPVKHVVIARGLEPQHGRDGYFKMIYKDDRSSVGTETDDGSIDYRSRGVIRSVESGELLGRLYLPEKGQPGRDVFGRIIPAKEGQTCEIIVGEKVQTSSDGLEFHAAEKGMVFFVDNQLAVTDIYQTQGDVNIKTGNISIEKGSVHVQGAVLAGFTVDSPRNILVDDVVENATLSAKGDIEVYGGFLMDKEGARATIHAGGSISALFATNATLEAVTGSVFIAHEITNCIVYAGDKVIATKGRGKIIGSTIRCARGVEANEIGTPLGVETSIFLGVEPQDMSEHIARRKKLQALIQKIFGALGQGEPKEILAKAPPEKRQAVADLLKARLRAENELLQIKGKIDAARNVMRKSMRARIKVHRTVHPGTIINCFGKTLKVDKPLEYSQIFYDPKEDKIVVNSI